MTALIAFIGSVTTSWAQNNQWVDAPIISLGPLHVVLERSVFFPTAEGEITEITEGIYLVSQEKGGLLTLTGDAGKFRLSAQPYEHGEPIPSELALSFSGGENDHHIALLDEDGVGLVAAGSYTGVTARAGTRLSSNTYRTRIQAVLYRPSDGRYKLPYKLPTSSGSGGNATPEEPSAPPEPVLTPLDVALSRNSSFATVRIDAAPAVYAWGATANGALGDGTNIQGSYRLTPEIVPDFDDVAMLEAGYSHAMALKHDGTVWAWGLNWCGQLGDDTVDTRTIPVRVHNLSDIVSIAAGHAHSLAINQDGSVWAWGKNDRGQLGDNSATDRLIPVQVAGLTNVKQVAGGCGHSLAVKQDGTVWAWGRGYEGQLGHGRSRTDSRTPVPVVFSDATQEQRSQGNFNFTPISGVVAVAAGCWHSLALTQEGRLWAWGNGYYGQLGYGNYNTQTSWAFPVPEIIGVTSIKAAVKQSMALKDNGTVWVWGVNEYGQLGIDPAVGNGFYSPVQIPDLGSVDAIDASEFHGIAIKNDGTMWAWGHNFYGKLGDGTTTNSRGPVRVLLE